MSSNTETGAAQSWEIALCAFFIIAVLVFFGKLFWEPTYKAVKRIEANQQPCQGK